MPRLDSHAVYFEPNLALRQHRFNGSQKSLVTWIQPERFQFGRHSSHRSKRQAWKAPPYGCYDGEGDGPPVDVRGVLRNRVPVRVTAMETNQIPLSLTGKVLCMRLIYDSHALLSNARFESIGGKQFALGNVPPGVVPGFDNRELAIAWDQVEQFYVFDSLEEFFSARKTWKKKKPAWFQWE